MALYVIETDTKKIPIRVVSSWASSGGEQTVIQYDAPGTNSGNTIVTGRTAYGITLAGVFVGTLDEIQIFRNQLLQIKDLGKTIGLGAPLNNNDTGRYIITSLHNAIGAGLANSSAFTMTLTEHRESNVKQASVNLISFEPIENFKNRFAATLGGTT